MMSSARSSPTNTTRVVLYALILVGTYFCAYNANIDGNLDLYHEGDRLAHIDAMRDGALPFSDIYIPHGLGEDVFKPLLACQLFGDSVASLRTLGQNSYVYRGYLPPLGIVAALIACMAVLRCPMLAVLMALVLLSCLCEITERHCFGFLAIAAVGMHLHRERTVWLILTGLFVGCAMLYSLEVGLYALATIIAWFCLDAWIRPRMKHHRCLHLLRCIGIFLLGLAIPIVPVLVWCGTHGIIGDLVDNVKTQLFLRGEIYPAPYPTPSWRAGEDVWQNLRVSGGILSFFYLMPALYLVGLAFAVSAKRTVRPTLRSSLTLLSLLGICFWASVYSRPELWHLAYTVSAFALFAVTAFIAVREAASSPLARFAWMTPLLLVLLSLLQFGSGGVLTQNLLHRENRLLPAHLRSEGQTLVRTSIPRLSGLRVGQRQAAYLEAIVGYIQSHTKPDDTLLDLSDQGLIFFLTQRKSASKFHYYSHCRTPALIEQLAEEVSQDKLPLYVIRYKHDALAPGRLGLFIETFYRPEVTISYTCLWRRISEDGHPATPPLPSDSSSNTPS